MKRRTVVALVFLTVPLLAATGTMLWVATTERSDPAFFPRNGPRNSAEAAAMGNLAAMLQFLRIDNDPTRVHPVRRGIISPDARWVTTLEAAIWSRREETIDILDREGFLVGADTRRYLACLALDLGREEIAEDLAPSRTCVEDEVMKQVIARDMPGEDEAR
jgi:hypothetical protein